MISKDGNSGKADVLGSESAGLVAQLRALEEELDDVLEQRRVALARPMRGAERDHLRHQFERQEARLRETIEAVKARLNER